MDEGFERLWNLTFGILRVMELCENKDSHHRFHQPLPRSKQLWSPWLLFAWLKDTLAQQLVPTPQSNLSMIFPPYTNTKVDGMKLLYRKASFLYGNWWAWVCSSYHCSWMDFIISFAYYFTSHWFVQSIGKIRRVLNFHTWQVRYCTQLAL